jgi:hypothetical protein
MMRKVQVQRNPDLGFDLALPCSFDTSFARQLPQGPRNEKCVVRDVFPDIITSTFRGG